MKRGRWVIDMPKEWKISTESLEFESLEEVFEFRNRDAVMYKTVIKEELERIQQTRQKLGALIIEPVILGAGGMIFA